MGCAVAPLAGLDCAYITWAVIALYVLFAIFIVLCVSRLSSTKSKVRNTIGTTALLAAIPFLPSLRLQAQIATGTDTTTRAHKLFERLCYTQSREQILRRAERVSSLSIAPMQGPKGDYEFDLFFGSGKPKTWGLVPVEEVPTNAPHSHQLTYEYRPVSEDINGQKVVFHGVEIKVVDASSGEILGTRVNYQWGSDFKRGFICLGSDWFMDNDAFAERMLGPKYTGHRIAEGHGRMRQQFLSASEVLRKDVDVTLRNYRNEELLPNGSKYDYNNRTIELPRGRFRMLGYGNAEPIPIVATVEQSELAIFVMLPQGWQRSHPPRQILFHFRKSTGEEVRNIFALLPPGLDWSNGWGFDPVGVSVSDSAIEFSLYGNKVNGPSNEKYNNAGRYRIRYDYRVEYEK